MSEQPKPDIKLVKPNPPEEGNAFSLKKFPMTEYGNAERVVRRYGHLFRYEPTRKRWYRWNGKQWKKVFEHEIEWFIKKTIRAIIAEETAGLSEPERILLSKFALASEAQSKIRAVLESLKSQPGVCVDTYQLDGNIWLVNFENGTLDLLTMTLREHRAEDYITRIIDIDYVPEARCPTFLSFLHTIFAGNQELIALVKRIFGYALCGDTSEQCFFIFIGNGQNGKSTLLLTIFSILGPYAQQAPAELLILKSHPGISNDLAGTVGMRAIAVMELDHERPFAESLIKQLTGGDKIRARNLYEGYFEFRFEGKLFILANQPPKIRGLDDGIWRRVMKILFAVRIPDEERDKNLLKKLETEKAGILAWMVEGFQDWQQKGLDPPEIVKCETRQYRVESDSVKSFLEECCELKEGVEVQAAVLHEAYHTWATENRRTLLTQKAFGGRLAKLGYENRKKSVNWWQGITLLTPAGAGTMG